ncbi:uncharacterized protein Z518_08390 [Rhinocladiella mackenziei CBS 650.93]|uniref:Uncharacterized protein n=1 Tax=Rhinocladiella mackenziei CBS 650.93 TaxID=1442369 RepID=A0A0D2I9E9_9EURO|nr:uncharacterized protein Z518_08390 [Rhinocladiella mackenziei CBS 650.93]KIX02449.1 hypothetical protein Z518_08390 [Rhinocladiella mackenziei CBS 650.93]
MTAVRLSPAANLLRHSKLFAVPSPLSLPATEPSSEPIAHSDTATTPYPIRAAFETPTSSLHRGDWGLKRSLPVATTTKSGTPVIRIQGGIDTPEHIADFESAADHVLTLRKYQELNLRVTLPAPREWRSNVRTSAFHPEVDHSADTALPKLNKSNAPSSWLQMGSAERAAQMPKHLKDTLEEIAKVKAAEAGSEATPASQPPPTRPPSSIPAQTRRRWRYSGPYLAGMNGMEFDAFLNKITREKKAAFRAYVKEHMRMQRFDQKRAEALDQGRGNTAVHDTAEITDEDVTRYLRYLRSEPGKFGPLIVEFFDLADGPKPTPETTEPWSYGRDTISADPYKESGPPRTHPSAGLSYLKSDMFSPNDITVGPSATRHPVPARLLKSNPITHGKNMPYIGVAGFVVPQPSYTSLTDFNWKWEPKKDGPKFVVTPTITTISQAGKVEIQSKIQPKWHLEDDFPVNSADRKARGDATTTTTNISSSQLPNLDNRGPRNRYSRYRFTPEPSQDISAELDIMTREASRSLGRKII